MNVEMRTKQRIIGIIVLVILMLIIIPLLFTGSKRTRVQTELTTTIPTPPAASTPSPEPAVTPMSTPTPAVTAPIVNVQSPATEGGSVTDESASDMDTMQSSPDVPAVPAATATTSSTTGPVAIVHKQAVVTKIATPIVEQPVVMHRVVKPKVIIGSKPIVVTKVKTSYGWRLQVASFSNPLNAKRYVKKLSAKGFRSNSEAVMINGKRIYRVYVGRGLTYSDADRQKSKLASAMGIKAIMTRN